MSRRTFKIYSRLYHLRSTMGSLLGAALLWLSAAACGGKLAVQSVSNRKPADSPQGVNQTDVGGNESENAQLERSGLSTSQSSELLIEAPPNLLHLGTTGRVTAWIRDVQNGLRAPNRDEVSWDYPSHD